MTIIKLLPRVGPFAENKDIAREIRTKELIPLIDNDQKIILDFAGIEGATQSFVHALISDLIRRYGSTVLDKITFKNCNDSLKEIVRIVAEYMQEI